MNLRRLVLAFQFLTIIPLPAGGGEALSEKDIGGSSAFFPLVGLLQGLLLLFVYLLFRSIFPQDVLASLLVAVLTASNGGFHLEGLSDTFDALASRKSRGRMLEIMKDSTSGPAGVIAIVLVLLLKYVVLKNLLEHSSMAPSVPLLLFPLAGRWSMVPALFHGKSARKDGLGRVFIENTGRDELLIASATAAILMIVAFISGSELSFNAFLVIKVLVLLSGLYILSFALSRFFQKRFGGLTGDNLGAVSEMSEIFFLSVLLGLG